MRPAVAKARFSFDVCFGGLPVESLGLGGVRDKGVSKIAFKVLGFFLVVLRRFFPVFARQWAAAVLSCLKSSQAFPRSL